MLPARKPFRPVCWSVLGLVLTWAGGAVAQAPAPRAIVYIGPLYPKRYASDNGIPGTGNYAYNHYRWPSLREALAEYGWFGRKIRSPEQVGQGSTLVPPVNSPSPAPPAQLLPPSRMLP